MNKKIICIDSDGCAMDTMNYKHMRCFGPLAANIFGVSDKKKFLEIWNNINLFSRTRGVNRFVGLYLAFDKINMPLKFVKNWAIFAGELSNISLKQEIEKTKNQELEKALLWSVKVNEEIERLKYLAKPFDNVKEAIIEMKKYLDVAIVSAANNEAIEDEWKRFGLLEYVDYVMGQNQGTKKQCIKALINKGYNPSDIVMIGDSPGDIDAGKANNTLVYPLIINAESESFKEFKEDILFKFLKDEYDDEAYIEKYNNMLGELSGKIS